MTPKTPLAPAAIVQATFVIEDERARQGFLAWAGRKLAPGLAIVQVKDVHGRRRAFRTVPASPRAQLVALETPLLLRGGLTQVTRYYCVPSEELDAHEVHYERDRETHRYDVRLQVSCRGAAPERVSA